MHSHQAVDDQIEKLNHAILSWNSTEGSSLVLTELRSLQDLSKQNDLLDLTWASNYLIELASGVIESGQFDIKVFRVINKFMESLNSHAMESPVTLRLCFVRALVTQLLSEQVARVSDKIHLYLADDEPEIGDLLTDLFEDSGHKVSYFSNPEDLLESHANHPCDVMLLDHQMPEMTGVELMSKLRQFDSSTPVVMLSGLLTRETCIEAAELGIYSLLTKPPKIDDLVSTINNAAKLSKTAQVLDAHVSELVQKCVSYNTKLSVKGMENVMVDLLDIAARAAIAQYNVRHCKLAAI